MRLRVLCGFLGAVGVVLAMSRCFSPSYPVCSFQCGAGEPRCPDEYECRADNLCHLKGSTEACPFTVDLAPAADMSAPRDGGGADQAAPADQAGAAEDQAGADGG